MSKTVFVFVLLVTWSISGLAQRWSIEQEELIEQVKRCNDGWSESIEHQRYELFEKVCPETAGAVYWHTNADAPVNDGATGSWRLQAAANRRATWADLQPTVIQIDGDLGLIYYSVVWTAEPKAGEARRNPTRRLTVFRRRNGQWLMAGGSISAVNAPSTSPR